MGAARGHGSWFIKVSHQMQGILATTPHQAACTTVDSRSIEKNLGQCSKTAYSLIRLLIVKRTGD
jgi:hypothetical protein